MTRTWKLAIITRLYDFAFENLRFTLPEVVTTSLHAIFACRKLDTLKKRATLGQPLSSRGLTCGHKFVHFITIVLRLFGCRLFNLGNAAAHS
jgi:hypothetical protein